MNRWSLLYCTSCVGALLALSGCGKSEPAQPAPAPTGSAAVAADVQALPVDAAKLAAAQPMARSCYLDMVNDKRDKNGFDVKRGESNRIVGWVVGKDKAAPPRFTLILKADQSYALQGRTGGVRPDVAKAVGNAAASKAGFAVGTTLSGVEPGSYEAMILVESPDGDVLCDLHRGVRVAG